MSGAVTDLVRWARAAAAGDRVAAGAFVRATQHDVWRWHTYLVGRDSAEDLSQETYARAFRALPAFRFESDPRTWLLAIARRVAADELRSRQRRRRLDALLARQPSSDVAPDCSGDVTTDVLLRGLDADRRAAFVLTQVLGLSYAEAAAVCDCAVGTIRSRVARARADLVAALDQPATGDGTVSRPA
ncbi:MAG: sigma-70 family RNA polymerase sigma factor [Actinomycetota bacterium]|nr:sigma-70 family RNA polymerase sigma factor [Actinomycetota bacterium]